MQARGAGTVSASREEVLQVVYGVTEGQLAAHSLEDNVGMDFANLKDVAKQASRTREPQHLLPKDFMPNQTEQLDVALPWTAEEELVARHVRKPRGRVARMLQMAAFGGAIVSALVALGRSASILRQGSSAGGILPYAKKQHVC